MNFDVTQLKCSFLTKPLFLLHLSLPQEGCTVQQQSDRCVSDEQQFPFGSWNRKFVVSRLNADEVDPLWYEFLLSASLHYSSHDAGAIFQACETSLILALGLHLSHAEVFNPMPAVVLLRHSSRQKAS